MDEQDFTALEYHDQHFFDCFAPVFEASAQLNEVTYYATIESGFIQIIKLLFTCEKMSFPVYLKVNPDFDTIEIHGHFPETDDCYRSFIPQTLWGEAIDNGLFWVWRIRNHQGYVDGIQFEFHNHLVIQIMGLASELITKRVVEETGIVCEWRTYEE